MTDIKKEFEKLAVRNKNLDQSRANAKDQLEITNKSVNEYKKQIDDIFQQNMNVEKLQQLKNELDAKNIKIAECELQIDKLSNQNSEINQKTKMENNILEENNDLKIENNRLKSKIESLTHEQQSIESRFNKLQTEYQNLNVSNTQQSKNIITLKSDQEQDAWKHNEDIRRLKSQIESMVSELDRANQERNEKSAKLEAAEQKY